ncbi:hypothetical protein MC885_003583 [Smutsia gigantea]|nr:hypothetical protein MC885_003583 [Smutsia gigantea]
MALCPHTLTALCLPPPGALADCGRSSTRGARRSPAPAPSPVPPPRSPRRPRPRRSGLRGASSCQGAKG